MRRFKKRKIFTKNQKKRSEDVRVLAAGRFHLPAVAVCWMKEGCEGADMERWGGWGALAGWRRNGGCWLVED